VYRPELIRLSERQLNISIFFHYINSSTVHELQCTLIIGLGKSMLVRESIDGIVSKLSACRLTRAGGQPMK
jgi:hypothetical protein